MPRNDLELETGDPVRQQLAKGNVKVELYNIANGFGEFSSYGSSSIAISSQQSPSFMVDSNIPSQSRLSFSKLVDVRDL